MNTESTSVVEIPKPVLVIDVPVEKKAIVKKPAIQERLENSPTKATTPEKIKEKLERAEKRRKDKENERVAVAHKFVEHFAANQKRAPMANNNVQ